MPFFCQKKLMGNLNNLFETSMRFVTHLQAHKGPIKCKFAIYSVLSASVAFFFDFNEKSRPSIFEFQAAAPLLYGTPKTKPYKYVISRRAPKKVGNSKKSQLDAEMRALYLKSVAKRGPRTRTGDPYDALDHF